MSFAQTINYDTAGNFVYDTAVVEFVGSLARLKKQDNAGQTFQQTFTADTGFTYNAAFTEFTAGVARQKDTRTAGLLAYYAWTTALGGSSLDGNYGTTTVGVSVLTGAPAVTGGFLNLTGAANKSVALANAGTYTPANVGTIALRYKPNYSGAPAAVQYLLSSGNSASVDGLNYFAVRHDPAGSGLFVEVYNSAGAGVGTLTNRNFGAFSPTAGTTYEIVLQIDITSGATKLFVDGVQLGTTATATGVRTAASTVLYVGHDSYTGGTAGVNFSIKDLSFYSGIVAPANAFLNQTNVYNADTITLPAFAYSGVGSIQAWTALVATDTNAPRYILNNRYWNGSSWVVSDGTYAQATAGATAIAQITNLPAADALTVKVLFQASNTLQQSADLFTATYTGQIYPTTDPSIVNTSGVDADGLLSFAATFAASGSDGVRFQLMIGGINKYWTGTAWATSDGTYAQANTAADIETNKAALDLSDGAVLKVRVVLHSATGASTPSITSVVLGYDFFAPLPDEPTECIVFGFARDILGEVLATAPVLIVSLARQFAYNEEFVIMPFTEEVEADDDGRFEVSLVETETSSKTYLFKIRYTDVATNKVKTLKLGLADVPNAPSVNLAALTFT